MSNGFQFFKDGSLLIRQGASGDVTIKLKSNLTGYTARFELAKRAKADLLLNLTTENSGIVITPGSSLSLIKIVATATQTSSLPDSFSGVYNLEIISAGGQVTRLLEGRVNLTSEVATNP